MSEGKKATFRLLLPGVTLKGSRCLVQINIKMVKSDLQLSPDTSSFKIK